MKLDKSVVQRRVMLMQQEGVHFVTNANVGAEISAEEVIAQYEDVYKRQK